MELRERISCAWDMLVHGDFDWAEVGKVIYDPDGKMLVRCTACGLPRGTLRHAIHCTAKLCHDPDAALYRELKELREYHKRHNSTSHDLPEHPPGHSVDLPSCPGMDEPVT